MSAFLGILRLAPGPVQNDLPLLPDQPGLGPARLWNGSGALLIHRQRVNTPEDRFEAQPTPVWGDRGAVLFDGRLDDRAGLCQQLGINPGSSVPDSVLVARAFEKWDEEAPSRLIGDFAIAAWDSRRHRAILCADQRSLRPLYFHRSGGLLVFSTVLPALLSVPGVPCVLDEAEVADLLFNNHRDSRNCFFRGINRVLAGTRVTLSASGEKLTQYWYPAARQPLILRRDEEYVEAAREVLDKAVASRLRSIAPVPVQGSGGLDSSCIIVSVLGQTNAPVLPVFTAVPEHGVPVVFRPRNYISEHPKVAALQTAFPRVAPRFVEPAARPDVEFAPERVFEEVAVPLVSVMSSGWAAMTLQRMREEGATSCLAGHLGNSTLTWDGRSRVDSLFREGRWFRMAGEAAALAGYRPLPTARSIVRAMLGPRVLPVLGPRFRRMSTSLHRQAETDLNLEQRLRDSGDRRYTVARDGTEERTGRLTVRRALVGEVQGWMRSRYGIETRDPMGDVRLIDFCMSVPEDQFLRKGQTRWLARRMLRAAGVPPEITDNTSRGEWCPEWLARLERRRPGFGSEIARLRESPMAARLLDLDRLDRLVADWPQTADGVGPRRAELEAMFTRALHVGAFIRWAESKSASIPCAGFENGAAHEYPSLAITSP